MKYNSIQFKGQKLKLTSLLNVGKIVILGRAPGAFYTFLIAEGLIVLGLGVLLGWCCYELFI